MLSVSSSLVDGPSGQAAHNHNDMIVSPPHVGYPKVVNQDVSDSLFV